MKSSIVLESKCIKSSAQEYANNPDLVTLRLDLEMFLKLKKGWETLKTIEGATSISYNSPHDYDAYCAPFSAQLKDSIIEIKGIKYVPFEMDGAFPELYDGCDVIVHVSGDVVIAIEAKYSNDTMVVDFGTINEIEALFIP